MVRTTDVVEDVAIAAVLQVEKVARTRSVRRGDAAAEVVVLAPVPVETELLPAAVVGRHVATTITGSA